MKKRNMLTKVAALSMAALMTVTGLPVAGLDGALTTEAAANTSLVKLYLETGVKKNQSVVASALKSTEADIDTVNVEFGETYSVYAASGSTIKSNAMVISPDVAGKTGAVAIANDYSRVKTGSPDNGKVSAAYVKTSTVATFKMAGSGSSTIYTGGKERTLQLAVTPRDISTKAKLDVTLERVVSGGGVNNGKTKNMVYPDKSSNTGLTADFDGAEYKLKLSSATIGTGASKIDVTKYIDVTVDEKDADIVNVGEAGLHTIRISSKDSGMMTGFRTYTYTTGAGDLKDASVTLNPATAVYSVKGAEVKSSGVAVTLNGKDINNSNFTFSYSGNTSVTNQANLRITAKEGRDVKGYKDVKFGVTARDITDGIATLGEFDSAKVAAGTGIFMKESIPNQSYTGSKIAPKVTLYSYENITKTDSQWDSAAEFGTDDKIRFVELKENSDYKLVYNEENIKDSGSVEIQGINNYKGKLNATFKITDKDYDLAANAKIKNLTLPDPDDSSKTIDLANGGSTTFTGNDITPNAVVEYTDKNGAVTTLTSGTHFTVSYESNKKAGSSAKVIVNGAGIYGGKLESTFTITPMKMSDEKIDIVNTNITNDVVYNGAEQKPWNADVYPVTNSNIANASDAVLKEGRDFEVTYDNNINVGTATITFAGKGNYTGTMVKKFKITSLSLTDSSVTIKPVANQVYTGSELTPDIEAEFKLPDGTKKTLVKDTDYTLTYESNVGNDTNSTQGRILVDGLGNFTRISTDTSVGYATTASFNIVPAANDLSKAEITLVNPTYEYDGKYHTAAIQSVKMTSAEGVVKSLVQGTDYDVVDTVSVRDADTYKVQIKGIANSSSTNVYGGIGETEFTITPKAATVDFKLSATKKTYNGKTQKVTVKEVTRDGEAITEDDYTVSGTTSAKAAGKKTVTVTLTGNYAGSAKKTWTIAKAAQPLKVTPASKTFKASKVKKAAQKFTIKATKNQGKVTYKSSSKKVTVSSKGKVTVKKGTKKGTYKITVKAAGNANYNAGSKTVTVKVK